MKDIDEQEEAPPKIDKKPPTPEWWPEGRPVPDKIDPHRVYLANDGGLRWGTGVIVTRAERRKHGIRRVKR